jgi:hypothetical protein
MPPPVAGFELLPHTADIGIRASGASLEEVFEQATLGWSRCSARCGPDQPGSRPRWRRTLCMHRKGATWALGPGHPELPDHTCHGLAGR